MPEGEVQIEAGDAGGGWINRGGDGLSVEKETSFGNAWRAGKQIRIRIAQQIP